MIGMTRKEKSNVIPGVAIATALMPPLCTCGYGIANGSLRIALGAGYLFLVNTYFIFLTSALVLIILKVPQEGEVSTHLRKRMKRRLIINTILIMIPCIIVAGYMVKQANDDSKSITGFDNTVSTERSVKEMRILFPSVIDAKIGSLESVDADDNLITEKNIIVYLDEELEHDEAKRLEQWLQEVYSEKYNVMYVIESEE